MTKDGTLEQLKLDMLQTICQELDLEVLSRPIILMLSTVQPLLGVTKDDKKCKPAIYKLYDFNKGGTDSNRVYTVVMGNVFSQLLKCFLILLTVFLLCKFNNFIKLHISAVNI